MFSTFCFREMEYGLHLFQSKIEFGWKGSFQSAKGFIYNFLSYYSSYYWGEKIIKLSLCHSRNSFFKHMDEFTRQLFIKIPSFPFFVCLFVSPDLLLRHIKKSSSCLYYESICIHSNQSQCLNLMIKGQ